MIKAQITNPDDIEITMTFTFTFKQWKRIREELSDKAWVHPMSEVTDAIDVIWRDLDQTFKPKEAEK